MCSKKLNNGLIKEIFSFIKIPLSLQIVKYSRKTQLILGFSLNYFKIFYELNLLLKDYPFNQETFQQFFVSFAHKYKEDLNTLTKVFSYFINQQKETLTCQINPFAPFLSSILSLNTISFYLNLFSLDFTENTFITSLKTNLAGLDIDLTMSQNSQDYQHQKSLITELLSINSYKSIALSALKSGVFDCETFSAINFSNLEVLSLSRIKIKKNDMIGFFTQLLHANKQFPKLKELSLVLMKLDDDFCPILGQSLSEVFFNVDSLSIQGNEITDSGLETILERLTNNIKFFDISFNKITKSGYDLLIKHNNKLLNLKCLKMYNSELTELEEGKVKSIVSKMSELEYFDYFETRGGTQGIKEILFIPKIREIRLLTSDETVVPFLNKMGNIKDVVLMNCLNLSLTLEGLSEEFCEKLTHFGLIYSDLVSSHEINNLAKMKNLEKITLSFDSLNTSLLSVLCQNVFPKTKGIKELHIDNNHDNFSVDSARVLSSAGLINLPDLEEIVLSYNYIGIEGITEIVSSLSKNCKRVKRIFFQNCIPRAENKGTVEDWVKFWEELSKIAQLTEISLSENNLDDTSVDYLISNFKKFPNLRKINLSMNQDITEITLRKLTEVDLSNFSYIQLNDCDYIDEMILESLMPIPFQLYIGK